MPDLATEYAGFEQGTGYLVNDLLPAQFEMLQLFVPIDCWALGKERSDGFELIGSYGPWPNKEGPAILAEHFLRQKWSPQKFAGVFERRRLSRDECLRLGLKPIEEDARPYALKASLPDPDIHTRGVIAGIAYGINARIPEGPAHGIERCLAMMGKALKLHGELMAAEEHMRRTQDSAVCDALTGVLNRAGWEMALLKVAARGTPVAIAFVDLDCLKQVNDTEGHLAGDRLLIRAAKTITAIVRSHDYVARLGGDEFAVMLLSAGRGQALDFQQRLQDALCINRVSASIGVAVQSEAGSLARTIEMADKAMYEDKRNRQRYRINQNLRRMRTLSRNKPPYGASESKGD